MSVFTESANEAAQFTIWAGDIIPCLLSYLRFIIPAAVSLFVFQIIFHIRAEIFRKMLHTAAFCSPVVIVLSAEYWQSASSVCLLFAAVVYPVLWFFERFPWYQELFIQRRKGEIKKSLLLLFLTGAVMIAVLWGLFDKPFIEIASVIMWGTGDACAALIGKRFGRHHINWKYADHHKTWEGSAGMFCVSAAAGLLSLILTAGMPWYRCLAASVVTAAAGMITEMVTKNGYDTVTVPAADALILLIML